MCINFYCSPKTNADAKIGPLNKDIVSVSSWVHLCVCVCLITLKLTVCIIADAISECCCCCCYITNVSSCTLNQCLKLQWEKRQLKVAQSCSISIVILLQEEASQCNNIQWNGTTTTIMIITNETQNQEEKKHFANVFAIAISFAFANQQTNSQVRFSRHFYHVVMYVIITFCHWIYLVIYVKISWKISRFFAHFFAIGLTNADVLASFFH